VDSGLVKSEDDRMSEEKLLVFMDESLRMVFFIREGEEEVVVVGIWQ